MFTPIQNSVASARWGNLILVASVGWGDPISIALALYEDQFQLSFTYHYGDMETQNLGMDMGNQIL